MGGEVTATSVLGEGSRFRLRLLLSEAAESLRPSPRRCWKSPAIAGGG